MNHLHDRSRMAHDDRAVLVRLTRIESRLVELTELVTELAGHQAPSKALMNELLKIADETLTEREQADAYSEHAEKVRQRRHLRAVQ